MRLARFTVHGTRLSKAVCVCILYSGVKNITVFITSAIYYLAHFALIVCKHECTFDVVRQRVNLVAIKHFLEQSKDALRFLYKQCMSVYTYKPRCPSHPGAGIYRRYVVIVRHDKYRKVYRDNYTGANLSHW